MYFQRKLDQKIFAHLAYHWLETGQPFSSCRSAKLTRRNSSGNSWKKEPSLNFFGCLPHKRSFKGYHVFCRSNDREKTRNNMVVTRITPRRASWKLASASDSCQTKNLLVQEIKDLMWHGKVDTNHPRMYYAHFWTKTVNKLQSRRSCSNWCAREASQNSLLQLTQPVYSVRGMSCLNPLGYVRSKFPAEILISLASVHLLWKFSSPSVAWHWSAILNFAKLNPRSRSAKMNCKITRSPSSNYERQRGSALLRNIQNGKKTYRFRNLRKWKDFNKKQLTLLKMCATSLLCGPRADLWPFYGFLWQRFSLYINLQPWSKLLGHWRNSLSNWGIFPPPFPLGAMLALCIQVLIQHNQHCLGERGRAEIAPYNNISKPF